MPWSGDRERESLALLAPRRVEHILFAGHSIAMLLFPET